MNETPVANKKLSIPTENANLEVTLERGHPLFIVGANGTGKSALVQTLSSRNATKVYKIPANRPVSLGSSTTALPLSQRDGVERNVLNFLTDGNRLYKDDYGDQKIDLLLSKLITDQHNWFKKAVNYNLETGGMIKEYKIRYPSPFDRINEVVKRGALPIQIELSDNDEILARFNGGDPYGIQKLSDGQRNALLLASEIFTIEPEKIVFIDEPERHLHRSIMQPLLKAILAERSDCYFVVATHEIGLPAAMPESATLIVRGCTWENNNVKFWQTELLPADTDLPEDLRLAVLGSRDTILFTEGKDSSLDKDIYILLFPGVTIQPKGTSREVTEAVQGLRGSEKLNWIRAFGLIDRDDRTEQNIQKLETDKIYAIGCVAVEGIYYSETAIEALANFKASGININNLDNAAAEAAMEREAKKLIKDATMAFFKEISRAEIKTSLAKRRCEKTLKEKINAKAPKWEDIDEKDFNPSLNTGYAEEVEKLEKIITEKDINGIWARYPVHNVPNASVLEKVATALGFKNSKAYEKSLLDQISQNQTLAENLKKLLGSLGQVLASPN